jgi:proteic killer suppression protein
MILSFGDKDTEALFNRERVKKLSPDLLQRGRNKLLIIHAATTEDDLRIPPGNRFEKLKGDKKGLCSIRINDQWRVVFKWQNGNASDVTVTDYH